jgi:hypothetical protein
MSSLSRATQVDVDVAQEKWGPLPSDLLSSLRRLIQEHKLSVKHGDILLLSGGWYVTHAGLLRIARRKRCIGIQVSPVHQFCDRSAERWAFKATVYKSESSKGFVGYGDACPSNVSQLVRGAEMRVAETRAVNRALRKAYGVGICSVEEIGFIASPSEKIHTQCFHSNGNGSTDGNGTAPKVRDRLCQIIRQHKLDPELVKSYASDFCGVKTLREASREQVENFVQSLAGWAEKDRDALLCQLNSYLPRKEKESAA